MAKRGGYLGGSTIISPKTEWDENRSMALSRGSTSAAQRGGMERDPMSKTEIEVRAAHEARERRSAIKKIKLEEQQKNLRKENKITEITYAKPKTFMDMVEEMIAGKPPK